MATAKKNTPKTTPAKKGAAKKAAPAKTAAPPAENPGQSPAEGLPADAPDGSSTQMLLQEQTDAAEDRGYIGVKVDPTPNDRYALTSGDFRTPETDAEAALEAGSSKFAGRDQEDK